MDRNQNTCLHLPTRRTMHCIQEAGIKYVGMSWGGGKTNAEMGIRATRVTSLQRCGRMQNSVGGSESWFARTGPRTQMKQAFRHDGRGSCGLGALIRQKLEPVAELRWGLRNVDEKHLTPMNSPWTFGRVGRDCERTASPGIHGRIHHTGICICIDRDFNMGR